MGTPIREENVLVADFFNLGNPIFEMVETFLGEAARQQKDHPRWIKSERSAHLITGQPRHFQYLRILPNRSIKFKPKYKKFGVVYEKEGYEIGKRLLHVEVYDIKKEGKIELRGCKKEEGKEEEGKIRVFLINETNKVEEELEGVIQTFDESINNQGETLPQRIKSFIGALGGLVFEGKL